MPSIGSNLHLPASVGTAGKPAGVPSRPAVAPHVGGLAPTPPGHRAAGTLVPRTAQLPQADDAQLKGMEEMKARFFQQALQPGFEELQKQMQSLFEKDPDEDEEQED